MAPVWYPTIHVESHLCPGVPDLSYVIRTGGGHETGWLELKAVDDPKDIFVERSQHVWMEKHAGLVPIHFLIKVKELVFLIGGGCHGSLVKPSEEDLRSLSLIEFPMKTLMDHLPRALSQLTKR